MRRPSRARQRMRPPWKWARYTFLVLACFFGTIHLAQRRALHTKLVQGPSLDYEALSFCTANASHFIVASLSDAGPCVRAGEQGRADLPVLFADGRHSWLTVADLLRAVGADALAAAGGWPTNTLGNVAVSTNAAVRLVANPTQVSYATLSADCGADDDVGLIRCAAASLSLSMRRAWLAGANVAYIPFGSLAFWASRTRDRAIVPHLRYLGWWQLGNLQASPGTLAPANLSAATVAADAEAALRLASVAERLGMDLLIPGYQGLAVPSRRFHQPQQRSPWFGHQQPPLATAQVDAAAVADEAAEHYRSVRSALSLGTGPTTPRGSSGRALWALVDVGHESPLDEAIARTLTAAVVGSLPPDVGWMCQGWMGNPTRAVVQAGTRAHGAPPVILDLDGEWSPTIPQDRVFCATPNFGGRVGMHARLSHYARGAARSTVGVCAASEAPNIATDAEDTVLLAAWSGYGVALPSQRHADDWPEARAALACALTGADTCRRAVARLWHWGGPLNIGDDAQYMPPFASPLLGGSFGRLDHVPYDWSLLRAAARAAAADHDELCVLREMPRDMRAPCNHLQHTALDLQRQLVLDASASRWHDLEASADRIRCHLSRILSADATQAWTARNFAVQSVFARGWSNASSPVLASYAHQQRVGHLGAFDVDDNCAFDRPPPSLLPLYQETVQILGIQTQ